MADCYLEAAESNSIIGQQIKSTACLLLKYAIDASRQASSHHSYTGILLNERRHSVILKISMKALKGYSESQSKPQ